MDLLYEFDEFLLLIVVIKLMKSIDVCEHVDMVLNVVYKIILLILFYYRIEYDYIRYSDDI